MKTLTIKVDGYNPQEVKDALHEILVSTIAYAEDLDSAREQVFLLNALYDGVVD